MVKCRNVFGHFTNAWPHEGVVGPNEVFTKALALASVELGFLEHIVLGVGVEEV